MTPHEYLKHHKPILAGLRFNLFHVFKLLSAANQKRQQAFREAPTWAIAMAATKRGHAGEANEARSTIETMAFHAENEFKRRTGRVGV